MDQFSHSLSPASPDEAKSALRGLFGAFPLAGHEDMQSVVGTYLIAIDGYCLAAIQKSVMRFIRGEVDGHDGRFMPTPAQLSRDVKYRQGLMTPPSPRLALPAPTRPEPTEEERQRVADRARAFAATLGEKPRTADIVEDFDAWEARVKAEIEAENRKGRYHLSDEAIGRKEPTEQAA